MNGADYWRLFLLAAIWGGSFLLIRIVAPIFGPIVTVEARVLLAGTALALFVTRTNGSLDWRRFWRQYLVMGAINSAIPFVLITTAELRLTASMAAILNATSPLFGVLFAALWLKEPLTRAKVLGIVIAIAGIVVLVGWSPLRLTPVVVLSIGASLLASACYGLAGAYSKAKTTHIPSRSMAAGHLLGASLTLLAAVPFAPVAHRPTPAVLLCLVTLALLCTSVAYVLYFRLIADVGPARALTVTFLVPIFGTLWGALFLHESVTPSKLLGMAIILTGTAFVTGAHRRLLPGSNPFLSGKSR